MHGCLQAQLLKTSLACLVDSVNVKASERRRVRSLLVKKKSKDTHPVKGFLTKLPLIMSEVLGVPLGIRLPDLCSFSVGYCFLVCLHTGPMLSAHFTHCCLGVFKGPCV